MASKSGSSGNAKNGLRSVWVTSGGFGGTTGSRPTFDWVFGAGSREGGDSTGSSNDCCVSAESEVSSACSARLDGSREHLVQGGRRTGDEGCSYYVIHCASQREPGMPNYVISFLGRTPSITPRVIGSRNRGYVGMETQGCHKLIEYENCRPQSGLMTCT